MLFSCGGDFSPAPYLTAQGCKMIHKASRILIADTQHFFRMRIERTLNQLGFYRIAPVQSMMELLRLVEYADRPFDALIINEKLSPQSRFDPVAYCLDNPQILEALIYGSEQLVPGSVIHCAKIKICHTPLPDRTELQWLMPPANELPPQLDTVKYSH